MRLRLDRSDIVRTGVLLGALVVAFASPASTNGPWRMAQDDGTAARGRAPQQGVRPQSPHVGPRADRGHVSDDRAAMFDRLRDLLQLSPDQEPALVAFAAASRPGPEPADEDDDLAGPVDKRLDALAAKVERRDRSALARIDAAKSFYASLTPLQRKAADTLFGGKGDGARRDPLRSMVGIDDGGRRWGGEGRRGQGGDGPVGHGGRGLPDAGPGDGDRP